MGVWLQPETRGKGRGLEAMQLDVSDLGDGGMREASETLRGHAQPGRRGPLEEGGGRRRANTSPRSILMASPSANAPDGLGAIRRTRKKGAADKILR